MEEGRAWRRRKEAWGWVIDDRGGGGRWRTGRLASWAMEEGRARIGICCEGVMGAWDEGDVVGLLDRTALAKGEDGSCLLPDNMMRRTGRRRRRYVG
ncbi:hypothetical protein ACLOJK_041836 [Asimina triloba]